MPSCEKCWRDAGGSADRYRQILGEREVHPCTPEQQAGDGDECPSCKRKTIHQYGTECMNPLCPSRGGAEVVMSGHDFNKTFCELTHGDRFKANGSVWTKISMTTARKHQYSGHGNHAETICSFSPPDKVEFVECEHHRGTSDIVCPFCGEGDFDLIGLKFHFGLGHCEEFDETEMT